jgi:hypothetical protein
LLRRLATVTACAFALSSLLSGCAAYDTPQDVAADLPCTGVREVSNAFFGQPGLRCFMLGGASGQDSIEIITVQGDDFDALIEEGAPQGTHYLVGDGFIANGHVSLLGKAHRTLGGEFR